MLRKKEEAIPVNYDLLNTITPMNMQFQNNQLTIGEYTGKIYGVTRYPQQVDYGWLSKLTNIPSTIATIAYDPIDNASFIDSLSRSIILNRGTAESAKDPLAQQRAERAAIDGEKIMNQIDSGGETVGLLNFAVMPIGKDKSALEKVNRKTMGAFAVSKTKVRCMSHLQKEGYKNLSPTHEIYKAIEEITGRIMPLSTFVGGFPWSSVGFNDGTGYYFGKDINGGLIVLDLWQRGGDRTNSNIVITGIAGTGKSTVIKHLLLSEYMTGTKIIMIDAEREYKDLCKNLNGDWINCGGGQKINPLQVRPSPKDDDEEEGLSDLARYMQTLDTFHSLYLPDLTEIQKSLLKSCLAELYKTFKIEWSTDISKLKNKDFPTYSDLFMYIEMKMEEDKDYEEDYKTLLLLLKDVVEGADSFLWNGHTNIQTNTRCICFDTADLQESSDSIKRAQYFNVLSYCWQLMSANRTEKVLLVADETYLMIDPAVPRSMVFLRNVEKRARKYEAAIATVFHSLVDSLSPEIKMYTQALLDIPCIKILFGTDGQNLIETKELYNLSEAEEELLASKRRGQALCMIGSKRMNVKFEIPAYKFKYIGKAGGR